MQLRGNIIDLVNRKIFSAEIFIKNGIISAITPIEEAQTNYFLPGFIDAHVHVESSMLIPSEFARIAVTHGTVGTISDPHEIANVLGIPGVEFMIENGKKTPFHFYFGAPSCVPATNFETAGAIINAKDVDALLQKKEIIYLAEMMNFPGVINKDPEVLAKIAAAKKYGKVIDGHAPGLRGDAIKNYIAAGISSDHECVSYDEAKEKLELGMKIMIREGSAAKNFDALIPLLKEFPDKIMFCSDDKHPDDLIGGHINDLVARALNLGYDLFEVLRAASLNVKTHYNLPVGMLQVGDAADFIEINNLNEFKILRTFLNGECVAENGKANFTASDCEILNNFNCNKKSVADFSLKGSTEKVNVIEVLDGQLITNAIKSSIKLENGFALPNIEKDILKIAVINRYHNAPISFGFIKNFGLTQGAIASCVAHDCHNIVAVGTNDEDLCAAVNLIIENKGGISLANKNEQLVLPLPIAGIMTNDDVTTVAAHYVKLDRRAKELGSKLRAPYMSLSFMALLVIPKLKLSDLGLFDGEKFEFTDVFEENVL